MNNEREIKVLDHGFVRLRNSMGSDRDITDIARITHGSEAKSIDDDKKLIKYLFNNKHTSPFEFGKIVLHIKLPIFVMRQYVRHRMQNMNEESARYRELSNEFYIPETWRPQDTKNKQGSFIPDSNWNPPIEMTKNNPLHLSATYMLEALCKSCYDTYKGMINAGVAREMARMILPINIYTETIVCWDMNNLIKYLLLRADNHAQFEHVQYANAIRQIAKELFPWTITCFENLIKVSSIKNDLYKKYVEENGSPELPLI